MYQQTVKEHFESILEDFGTHYGPVVARNKEEVWEIFKSGVQLGVDLEHRRVLDILKELNPQAYYDTLDKLDKRKSNG